MFTDYEKWKKQHTLVYKKTESFELEASNKTDNLENLKSSDGILNSFFLQTNAKIPDLKKTMTDSSSISSA